MPRPGEEPQREPSTPDAPNASRRDLLKTAATAAIVGAPTTLLASTSVMDPKAASIDILRAPDLVRVFDARRSPTTLTKTGGDRWSGGGAEIRIEEKGDRLVGTYGGTGVGLIQLRWRGDLSGIERFLGDHWERSYADMEWRGEAPNRIMPWYFMANDGAVTHGFGVRTEAHSLVYWTADAEGISLWADVRAGGVPVELGGRVLTFAEIVQRQGKRGESAFAATQAFCRQMCPNPRLPKAPVYGTNDWNFAYGNNSAQLNSDVSKLISDLSPDRENRPFSLIDDGWTIGAEEGRLGTGPWLGNSKFGDMGEFAQKLKGMGVRPGLWFRPLPHLPDSPAEWRLSRDKDKLDPTHPAVKEHVTNHMRRFTGWGYEMVKHDFSTVDLLGRWGPAMGGTITDDGWRLHDSSRTNAEVLLDLYRTFRDAAGDDAMLIGCNTMGHLAAGTHELQRTGDDTSGRTWDRNRRMGVNTLAFRGPQHRAFFEVDPDIVSITNLIPWSLVEQWLKLVTESGTSLFVAIDPKIVEPKHVSALQKAFALAAKPQKTGEPLDWTTSNTPRRWKLRGKTVEFNWMGEVGGMPFGD